MTGVFGVHGLAIRSEIPFDAPAATDAHPLLQIHLGPVPPVEGDTIAGSDDHFFRATRSPAAVGIHFPGHASFRIDPVSHRIAAFAEPGSPPGLLPVLIAGPVMAVYLAVTGVGALHATAIERGGRALAIAGGSGAGKSTLAALLCDGGATLVADDLVRADPDASGAVTVHRAGRRLRLRDDTGELAGRFADRTVTADGRIAVAPTHTTTPSVPLGALLVPDPSRDATDTAVTPIPAAEALTAVLLAPRIIWHDRDLRTAQFRHAAAIARAVPAYRVTMPAGPPYHPSIAPAVLEACLPPAAAHERI